ncbi:hypothetical protein [uncultured Aquimarina sp.]|uniref:hypothetical protein n=1 Tax=uncultured Aquimarina sp. TaxID=575652 RepID=UPI00260A0F4E|nr:hypothetical protein [uncultured Aquimarina sp.]
MKKQKELRELKFEKLTISKLNQNQMKGGKLQELKPNTDMFGDCGCNDYSCGYC